MLSLAVALILSCELFCLNLDYDRKGVQEILCYYYKPSCLLICNQHAKNKRKKKLCKIETKKKLIAQSRYKKKQFENAFQERSKCLSTRR